MPKCLDFDYTHRWGHYEMNEKRTYKYYTTNRLGKTFLQKVKWDYMKCKRCGAELPRYPSYSEQFEEKKCPECGYVHRLYRNNIRRTELEE